MNYLTDKKLTIVGAAGMIGSNMAQTALTMKLTPNVCLYDPYGPGLEGVAEEMFHCGFESANITFTTDIAEALTGASYIVSSGGAARKAGMTREDLLKGNAGMAVLGCIIPSKCDDFYNKVPALRSKKPSPAGDGWYTHKIHSRISAHLRSHWITGRCWGQAASHWPQAMQSEALPRSWMARA